MSFRWTFVALFGVFATTCVLASCTSGASQTGDSGAASSIEQPEQEAITTSGPPRPVTTQTVDLDDPYLLLRPPIDGLVGAIGSEGQFNIESGCVVFQKLGEETTLTVAVSDRLLDPLREEGTVLRIPMHYIPLGDGTIYRVVGEPVGTIDQLPAAHQPTQGQDCPPELYLVSSARLPRGTPPNGTAVVILLSQPGDDLVVSYNGQKWSQAQAPDGQPEPLELLASGIDGIPGWEVWSTARTETLLLVETAGGTQIAVVAAP